MVKKLFTKKNQNFILLFKWTWLPFLSAESIAVGYFISSSASQSQFSWLREHVLLQE